MKRLLTLALAAAMILAAAGASAQSRPRSGKKTVSPFIEGRQKVRQADYDTVWKFTNFSTKDTKIYFLPFDYSKMPSMAAAKKPDWQNFTPVVNYLRKGTRSVATICAVFAVNPLIEDAGLRAELAEQGRQQALASLESFEAWKTKQEMRNKLTYQVAEVDYKYWLGRAYDDGHSDEPLVQVGLLMYFGSKKKAIFSPDTESRVFESIRFFPNDATIVDSWMPLVDTLASYLRENERKSVLLTGYSDNQGTEAYLIGVSRQRATEVKKALLQRGIDKDRIEVEAKGDADPVGDNSTREGRIQNNRVAIKIL